MMKSAVEFFGSVVEIPKEWERGKSDIVVFAFGNNISGETKRMTYKLFWKLNQKYDLRLENVAVLHSLIFFIDSPLISIVIPRSSAAVGCAGATFDSLLK